MALGSRTERRRISFRVSSFVKYVSYRMRLSFGSVWVIEIIKKFSLYILFVESVGTRTVTLTAV